MPENEPVPEILKKVQPKSKWDDEDVEEDDIKESWEDEDEPVQVTPYLIIYHFI